MPTKKPGIPKRPNTSTVTKLEHSQLTKKSEQDWDGKKPAQDTGKKRPITAANGIAIKKKDNQETKNPKDEKKPTWNETATFEVKKKPGLDTGIKRLNKTPPKKVKEEEEKPKPFKKPSLDAGPKIIKKKPANEAKAGELGDDEKKVSLKKPGLDAGPKIIKKKPANEAKEAKAEELGNDEKKVPSKKPGVPRIMKKDGSPKKKKGMMVYIKYTGGEIQTIETGKKDLISVLKEKIQEKTKVPVHQQKVLYDGTQLCDEKSVGDYCIYDHSYVQLVRETWRRLPGEEKPKVKIFKKVKKEGGNDQVNGEEEAKAEELKGEEETNVQKVEETQEEAKQEQENQNNEEVEKNNQEDAQQQDKQDENKGEDEPKNEEEHLNDTPKGQEEPEDKPAEKDQPDGEPQEQVEGNEAPQEDKPEEEAKPTPQE